MSAVSWLRPKGKCFYTLSKTPRTRRYWMSFFGHIGGTLCGTARGMSRKAVKDRLESSVEAILALSGQPGVVFSEKSDGPFYEPAPRKGSHGHLPSNPQMKSGLVAYGAGIREGVFLDEMDIRDVSALVAYLLGLEFPSGDGVLPISLLSGVR